MKVLPLTECHRGGWNLLVSRTPESGFMQSWDWSCFKEADGFRVTRLGVVQGDDLIAGAMVYSVNPSFGSSPLELPHGPVLPWSDESAARQAAELLWTEFLVLADQTRAPFLRMEPLIFGAIPHWMGPLVRAPLDLIPTPTLIMDLSRSEDALLESMKPKGRYNIRLALRKGVEVTWSNDMEALENFYLLFDLTCKRHGFAGEPKGFFSKMLRSLGSMVRIYFASYCGMILSTALTIQFGDRATYLYGGSLPFLRSVMAPYAMHWRIMLDAKARGCRLYDFYGIAPTNEPMHGYARFSQFKSRFGGKIQTTTGAHDHYFYSHLAALWVEKMGEAQERSRP